MRLGERPGQGQARSGRGYASNAKRIGTTLCENKAIAILDKLQEGRPALFHKDGGAMLIAIVLDRPLQEAQDLVDQPHQFLQEIKKVLDDKKSHPILERILRMIQGDVAKQEATSSKERPYYTEDMDDDQYQ